MNSPSTPGTQDMNATDKVSEIEQACHDVWDATRPLGGAFWYELPGAQRSFAIECFKAGNLAAINASRRSAPAEAVKVKAGLDLALLELAAHLDLTDGVYADEAAVCRLAASALSTLAIHPMPEHPGDGEPVAWRWQWGETGEWQYGHHRPAFDDPRSPYFGKLFAVHPLFASPHQADSGEVTDEMVEKIKALEAACDQARLALAGMVSVQSAIDRLDTRPLGLSAALTNRTKDNG